MVATMQHSFAAGELSPSFWGRSDHPRYKYGVKSAENMLVTKSGALRRRPGFSYYTDFAVSSVNERGEADGNVRLFLFETKEGFHPVLLTSKGFYCGSDYTVFSPAFDDAPPPEVQFIQIGDIGYITCQNRPALAVYKNTNGAIKTAPVHWTLSEDYSSSYCVALPEVDAFVSMTRDVRQFSFFPPLKPFDQTQQHPVLEDGKTYQAFYCGFSGGVYSGGINCHSFDAPEDKDHKRQPWYYKIGFVYDIPGRGGEVESVADSVFTIYPPRGLALYVDWDNPFLIISPPEWLVGEYGTGWGYYPPGKETGGILNTIRPVKCRIYRGKDGVYGLVGEVGYTSYDSFDYQKIVSSQITHSHESQTYTCAGANDKFVFLEDGSEPDYSQQPPAPLVDWENGFNTRTTAPLTLGFYQQRLVVGGVTGAGDRLFFSNTGRPYEFTKQPDFSPLASDAIDLKLSSGERETIQSVVSYNGRLVVITDKSLWDIHSADGVVTASSASAVRLSGVGACRLRPIVIRNVALFVSSTGNEIYEVFFDAQNSQWATRELGQFARHLLDGHKIVAWAYQQTPDPVVWMVREDGALLSMSYAPEVELCAWTHHTLEGFRVLDIASTGANVLLLVRRGERLELLRSDDLSTLFLDGARAVVSPAKAAELGMQAWKLFPYVTSLPTVQTNTIPSPKATDTSCVAGNPVVARVELLDSPTTEDLGLRPKTLTKLALDIISQAGPRIGEAAEAVKTPEVVEAECRRRIVTTYIIHSYNKEATGFIESSAPVALNILGASREVDYGDTRAGQTAQPERR